MPSVFYLRHPVDGHAAGVAHAVRLLRLAAPPPKEGLLFDLLRTDEPGAMDRFQLTLPLDAEGVAKVIAALDARTPEAFVADPLLGPDLAEVVGSAEWGDATGARRATARFLGANRATFQPDCRDSDAMWFGIDPTPSDWTALWYRDGFLSYLHRSEG